MTNTRNFIFEMESSLHAIVALSDALSKAAADLETERNTLSFLADEIDDRIKQLRGEWREAFRATAAPVKQAA